MVIETGATACIGGTCKGINNRNVSNIGDVKETVGRK
jgi:hypothetical protein